MNTVREPLWGNMQVTYVTDTYKTHDDIKDWPQQEFTRYTTLFTDPSIYVQVYTNSN